MTNRVCDLSIRLTAAIRRGRRRGLTPWGQTPSGLGVRLVAAALIATLAVPPPAFAMRQLERQEFPAGLEELGAAVRRANAPTHPEAGQPSASVTAEQVDKAYRALAEQVNGPSLTPAAAWASLERIRGWLSVAPVPEALVKKAPVLFRQVMALMQDPVTYVTYVAACDILIAAARHDRLRSALAAECPRFEEALRGSSSADPSVSWAMRAAAVKVVRTLGQAWGWEAFWSAAGPAVVYPLFEFAEGTDLRQQVVRALGGPRGWAAALKASPQASPEVTEAQYQDALEALRALRRAVHGARSGNRLLPLATRGPSVGPELEFGDLQDSREAQLGPWTDLDRFEEELWEYSRLLKRAQPLLPRDGYLPLHLNLALSPEAVDRWFLKSGPDRDVWVFRTPTIPRLISALVQANVPLGRLEDWMAKVHGGDFPQSPFILKDLPPDGHQLALAAGRREEWRLHISVAALTEAGPRDWRFLIEFLYQLLERGTETEAQAHLRAIEAIATDWRFHLVGRESPDVDRTWLEEMKLYVDPLVEPRAVVNPTYQSREFVYETHCRGIRDAFRDYMLTQLRLTAPARSSPSVAPPPIHIGAQLVEPSSPSPAAPPAPGPATAGMEETAPGAPPTPLRHLHRLLAATTPDLRMAAFLRGITGPQDAPDRFLHSLAWFPGHPVMRDVAVRVFTKQDRPSLVLKRVRQQMFKILTGDDPGTLLLVLESVFEQLAPEEVERVQQGVDWLFEEPRPESLRGRLAVTLSAMLQNARAHGTLRAVHAQVQRELQQAATQGIHDRWLQFVTQAVGHARTMTEGYDAMAAQYVAASENGASRTLRWMAAPERQLHDLSTRLEEEFRAERQFWEQWLRSSKPTQPLEAYRPRYIGDQIGDEDHLLHRHARQEFDRVVAEAQAQGNHEVVLWVLHQQRTWEQAYAEYLQAQLEWHRAARSALDAERRALDRPFERWRTPDYADRQTGLRSAIKQLQDGITTLALMVEEVERHRRTVTDTTIHEMCERRWREWGFDGLMSNLAALRPLGAATVLMVDPRTGRILQPPETAGGQRVQLRLHDRQLLMDPAHLDVAALHPMFLYYALSWHNATAPAAGLEEPPRGALPAGATPRQQLAWLHAVQLAATAIAIPLHNGISWPEAATRATRAAHGSPLGPLVRWLLGAPPPSSGRSLGASEETVVPDDAKAAALLLPDLLAVLRIKLQHRQPIPSAAALLRIVLAPPAGRGAAGREHRRETYDGMSLAPEAKEAAAMDMITRMLIAARLAPGSRGGLEESAPARAPSPTLSDVQRVGAALQRVESQRLPPLWDALTHLESLAAAGPSSSARSARQEQVIAALQRVTKDSQAFWAALRTLITEPSTALPPAVAAVVQHEVSNITVRAQIAPLALIHQADPGSPHWRDTVRQVAAGIRRDLDRFQALAWELRALPPEAISERVRYEDGEALALVADTSRRPLTPPQRRWIARAMTDYLVVPAAGIPPAAVQVVTASAWTPALTAWLTIPDLPPAVWRSFVVWGEGLPADRREAAAARGLVVVDTAEALRAHLRSLGTASDVPYWLYATAPAETQAALTALGDLPEDPVIIMQGAVDASSAAFGMVVALPTGFLMALSDHDEVAWLTLALERLAHDTPAERGPTAGLEEPITWEQRFRPLLAAIEPHIGTLTATPPPSEAAAQAARAAILAYKDAFYALADQIQGRDTSDLLGDGVRNGGGALFHLAQYPNTRMPPEHAADWFPNWSSAAAMAKALDRIRGALLTDAWAHHPPTPQAVRAAAAQFAARVQSPLGEIIAALARVPQSPPAPPEDAAGRIVAATTLIRGALREATATPHSLIVEVMTHEVNTALTGILPPAMLLADHEAPPSQTPQLLELVRKGVARVYAILEELQRLDQVEPWALSKHPTIWLASGSAATKLRVDAEAALARVTGRQWEHGPPPDINRPAVFAGPAVSVAVVVHQLRPLGDGRPSPVFAVAESVNEARRLSALGFPTAQIIGVVFGASTAEAYRAVGVKAMLIPQASTPEGAFQEVHAWVIHTAYQTYRGRENLPPDLAQRLAQRLGITEDAAAQTYLQNIARRLRAADGTAPEPQRLQAAADAVARYL